MFADFGGTTSLGGRVFTVFWVAERATLRANKETKSGRLQREMCGERSADRLRKLLTIGSKSSGMEFFGVNNARRATGLVPASRQLLSLAGGE
jgi:hypothetical protein